MAYDTEIVMPMVKARLNRLPGDTSLDEYLSMRVQAVVEEYEAMGVPLDLESSYDIMLLVDETVWQYQNRDKAAGMPEWLRLRRRERWLHQRDT